MLEFILALVIPKTSLVFITTCLVFILLLRIYMKVVVERPWKNFAGKFGFTLNWKGATPEVTGNCGGMDYKLYIAGRTVEKESYGCTVIRLTLPDATGFYLDIHPEKRLFNGVKEEVDDNRSNESKKIPYVVDSNRPDCIYRIITKDFCQLMAENRLVSLKIKNREIRLEHYGIITDIGRLTQLSRITWQTSRNLTRANKVANSSL